MKGSIGGTFLQHCTGGLVITGHGAVDIRLCYLTSDVVRVISPSD